MLDNGADPIIGMKVPLPPTTQPGQYLLTAFKPADAGEKPQTTFAEIMPATNVAWPLLAKLLNPRPSPTRSSPPITDPSKLMCGKPGRIPESMTATLIPRPRFPPANRGPRFMFARLIKY